jgi:ATP-dependent DNA helicase
VSNPFFPSPASAGFQWLVRRSFVGESVIIADEMGLGKTVQVIAYLAWQWQHLPGPVLIVGPLSTVGNWVAEVER